MKRPSLAYQTTAGRFQAVALENRSSRSLPLVWLLASLLVLSLIAWPAGAQETEQITARVAAFSAGEAPTSLADLKALQTRLQALSQRLVPSIVNVRVGPAQGSGVIISSDGYVLTAGHVGIEPDR